MEKKRVVVLGAGFGGLRVSLLVVNKLASLGLLSKYEVVLVDHSDCHLFTPVLYKLAADPHHPPECTYDTSSLIKGKPIRFFEGEVKALDLEHGDVQMATGETLKGDFFVIALGSETNYFGIPGLKESSLPLKTADHAVAIRSGLAKLLTGSGERKIVIGGAGANGIELAAEIKMWSNEAEHDNKGLRVTVSMLEASPTVLMGLDPRVQAIAMKRLAMLGVEVSTNAKIVGVAAKEASLDGGKKIPFDLFAWTGGVKTPDIVTQFPLEKEPHGRPTVHEDMECLPAPADLKLHAMVYGVGDSVCFMDPATDRPVPAVARAAILEANVVANNLVEEIKKAESPNYDLKIKNFIPSEYPYVIPIGKHWAVAKFGPAVFSGWPAWIFARLIEVKYLLSIMPPWKAFKVWMKME